MTSVVDTLLSLKVGETGYILTKHIKATTVRGTARRLTDTGEYNFDVSDRGLINEVKVVRLK
ncbi:hypothetical protein EZS27_009373 [termite gut metagenome]|uniref:Uncharacterized protein n=1 Tax=termite gut metagenome TaxID=433724 RepID=A0A5J4SC99_9ZZZZ